MAKHETDAGKAAKAAAKKATKKHTVHLFVLMDETGSMAGLEEAVVTGCNEFLHSFKDVPDARVWLAMFDWHPGEPRMRLKVEGEKAARAKELRIGDYRPRGRTPLNDAIMDALACLDEAAGKDEGVFVAIITDGRENASETSAETVAKAVAKREEKGWGFVYLGAKHDAQAAAANIGLGAKGKAFNFNATRGGVTATAKTTSSLAGTYASAAVAGGAEAAKAAYIPVSEELLDATGGKIEDDDEE